MLRTTKTIMTVVFFLIFSLGCSRRSEGLKQSDIEPLVNYILSNHVTQNTFDDEISGRTLDNMVSFLDPGKVYFTKSDIDSIMKDRKQLDDFVRAEKYEFLYKIFETYRTRFDQRMKLFRELIKINYDFTIDESIERDSRLTAFTDDESEIKERLRKRIKLQMLNYMTAGKTQDDCKKKVIKIYDLAEKENRSYKSDKMFETFLRAFSLALDPHTDYMSPDEYEDFKISMNLELEGIGAVLRSEEGYVYVESIIPGGPVSRLPENTKILPNDKIIAVAQGDSEPEDVIDIPLSSAVKKIRGKKGTTVKLSIVREIEKGKPTQHIIPIVRDKVVLENQAAKSEILENSLNGRKHKIGYIKLPNFYANEKSFGKDENAHATTRDMINEIKKLTAAGAEAMIIDLRGNPGGYLGEAITSTGLFIKDGPVLQQKSHDKVNVESDHDARIFYSGPMIVLIDKGSASASEIFAGALKDYGRALIIGSPSFGKGSVQNLTPMEYLIPSRERSGAIKVTVQLFYQPSGNSNHLNGIHPDIAIPDFTDVLYMDAGESKLKYPLKWSPIPKAHYSTYGNKLVSKSIISDLSAKSVSRRKSDKDFISLNEKMDKLRKQFQTTTISLKKDLQDDPAKEIETQQKARDKREKNDKIIDTKRDIMLREVFNIASDYVEILKNQ